MSNLINLQIPNFNNLCFFCLKTEVFNADPSNGNEGNCEYSKFPLHGFFRFLEFQDKNVCQFLQKVYGLNYKVPVCQPCSKTLEAFIEQYNLLELTRLRLEGILENVTCIMEDGEENPIEGDINHVNLFKNARSKVRENCKIRMGLSKPRLILNDISGTAVPVPHVLPMKTTNNEEISSNHNHDHGNAQIQKQVESQTSIINQIIRKKKYQCNYCDLVLKNRSENTLHLLKKHITQLFGNVKLEKLPQNLFQSIIETRLFKDLVTETQKTSKCPLCTEEFYIGRIIGIPRSWTKVKRFAVHLVHVHKADLDKKLINIQKDPEIVFSCRCGYISRDRKGLKFHQMHYCKFEWNTEPQPQFFKTTTTATTAEVKNPEPPQVKNSMQNERRNDISKSSQNSGNNATVKMEVENEATFSIGNLKYEDNLMATTSGAAATSTKSEQDCSGSGAVDGKKSNEDKYTCVLCSEITESLYYSIKCFDVQANANHDQVVGIPHFICETCIPTVKENTWSPSHRVGNCSFCGEQGAFSDSNLHVLKLPPKLVNKMKIEKEFEEVVRKNEEISERNEHGRGLRRQLRNILSPLYSKSDDDDDTDNDNDIERRREEDDPLKIEPNYRLVEKVRVFLEDDVKAKNKIRIEWGRRVRTQIECHICWRIFNTQHIRNEHVQKIHEQPKRFRCDALGCDYYSTKQHHLKSHKSSNKCPSVRGKKVFRKTYVCQWCGLNIRRKNESVKHASRCKYKKMNVVKPRQNE